MPMLMSAVATGQMSAVMCSIQTGQRPVAIVDICLVSTADICPVSTADISISIDHSASAFRINNQHIMEAATAADLTQASEIAVRYITLGSAAKGYVSGLTVRTWSTLYDEKCLQSCTDGNNALAQSIKAAFIWSSQPQRPASHKSVGCCLLTIGHWLSAQSWSHVSPRAAH